jgi:two-component system response regulator AtoC
MAETMLLIEDEPLLASELTLHFERQGWEVRTARTLGEASSGLLEEKLGPLVVLSDMSLPDGNALNLLERARSGGLGGEWVFLTGYGGVADSVRALRLGAYDFLEKPCAVERLDLVVNGAARSARAQRQWREHAAKENRRYSIDSFVGGSEAAKQTREMLERLARVPFSALLLGGETGTGKGHAARILHYSGPRRDGSLVEVNCAALPRELIESELFGHEAGAFTGAKERRRGLLEQAHGGTLFLDEIGDLSADLQVKLLNAIEDRSFRRVGGGAEIAIDVQIIAASNRDVARQTHEGTFREDLYHRLSVFSIELPALRQRIEDLNELVPLFVAEFNVKAGKGVRVIPESVWRQLAAHSWPGNVRELRNAVERCVLLAETEVFPEHWLHLQSEPQRGAQRGAASVHGTVCLPVDGSMSLEEMERELINAALERSHRNVTAAARLLGTTRETLRYRVQKHGLRSHED